MAVRRAKAARSRWLYLVSTSVKDFLTKNIGLNLASPRSLNKAALTAISRLLGKDRACHWFPDSQELGALSGIA